VSKASPAKSWFVYIVRCRDGTLYTGITNNLAERLAEHNRGRGCRYTAGRHPVELIYRESRPDRGSALRREAAVKKMSRERKLALTGLSRTTPRSGC